MILTLGLVATLQPAPRTFSAHTLVSNLNQSFVAESSGIAPSRLAAATYFTHNDSGDTARFFKFNLGGQVLTVNSLAGVTAVDWEDMASARRQGQSYLYLGDVGDNSRVRPSVRIYRVPEPTTSGAISQFQTYQCTYPDGPRNCETVMVHPTTGDIWLVEKTSGEAGVYRLTAPTQSGTYQLTKMGSIRIASGTVTQIFTGGAIAPEGKHVVLRSLTAAFEYAVNPTSFDRWINGRPRVIALRAEAQGEAITYSPDGRKMVTSSEGTPCPISSLDIGGPELRADF